MTYIFQREHKNGKISTWSCETTSEEKAIQMYNAKHKNNKTILSGSIYDSY